MKTCLKVVALVGIGIAFGSLGGSFALLKISDCCKDWPGKADRTLVTSAWRAYEERDLDGAHEMCEKASQEHPRIQYIMGRYEELRTGDYDEAAQWYLKAAEQGFCPAMVSLSECFRLGRGLKQDAEGLARIKTEKRQETWSRFKDRLGMLFAI